MFKLHVAAWCTACVVLSFVVSRLVLLENDSNKKILCDYGVSLQENVVNNRAFKSFNVKYEENGPDNSFVKIVVELDGQVISGILRSYCVNVKKTKVLGRNSFECEQSSVLSRLGADSAQGILCDVYNFVGVVERGCESSFLELIYKHSNKSSRLNFEQAFLRVRCSANSDCVVSVDEQVVCDLLSNSKMLATMHYEHLENKYLYLKH